MGKNDNQLAFVVSNEQTMNGAGFLVFLSLIVSMN